MSHFSIFPRQPAQTSALRKRTRMQDEKLLLSAVGRRHANTRGDSFETRSAKIGIGAATLLSFSQCESHATRCALTSRALFTSSYQGSLLATSIKDHRCCSMVRAGFSGGHIRTLKSSVRAVAFPFLPSSAESLAATVSCLKC